MLSTIAGIIFFCWLFCGSTSTSTSTRKKRKTKKHKEERDPIFDYYAYWADDDEG